MTIGRTISIRLSFGSLKLKFANYACELKHPDFLGMTKEDKEDYLLFVRRELKKIKKMLLSEVSDNICEIFFRNLSKE